MKLTLRKANAVQAAINEMIKTLDLNTQVTLNEFEDVQEQIDAVRNRFFTHDATRSKLAEALYEIRRKVATANADAGINDLLADVAALEKQVGYKNQLAAKGAQTALRVLNGQVKKNAEVKEDGFGYSRRDVVTSIFTAEEVEDFRRTAANAKREKQSLQDTLLELNVQTAIELDEETARFLERADIL
jgi:NTP pyrophosphatase (non-canonical NTP hydrolase)